MTFTPTVTISLDEYNKLKADASPVRIWRKEAECVLHDFYHTRIVMPQDNPKWNDVTKYMTYYMRSITLGRTPKTMDEYTNDTP